MRKTHRTAVTGGVMAAALAVSSWALVTPASANASATAEATTGAASTVVLTAQLQSSSTWTPGTEQDGDGNWVAYIECCGGFIREDVGTYETRKEARRAAREAAKEANGVVDGPGCIPPVLC